MKVLFIDETVGVKPNIVHIAYDFIGKYDDHLRDELIWDKSNSVIFNNKK